MKSNTHLSRKKKVTHLKWYPSLKLRMVHIYYTGAAAREPWGKSFLCQLIPLFHSHSDLNFSSGYHNFCSGLTVADGGWSNTLRSSSVGKQTNMQAEQLQGGVHYHRLNIGGVHCCTLAHISSAYSIVSCRFCPLNKDGVSLPQLKTRRNAAGNFSSRRCRVKWYVGEGCSISTTRMLCHPLPSSCRAWDDVQAKVRLLISTQYLQQICVFRCSSWNLKLPNCVRPIWLLVHLWQSALLAARLCSLGWLTLVAVELFLLHPATSILAASSTSTLSCQMKVCAGNY